MRIIQNGQSYELYAEPSPQVIHQLYLAQQVVPVLEELYPGECSDMYRANGRVLLQAVFLAGQSCITREVTKYPEVVQSLRLRALFGPVVFPGARAIADQSNGFAGFAVWGIE